MAVLKDKSGWYFRFRFNGREYEKHFGKTPQDKMDAKCAEEELKRHLKLAKRTGEGWDYANKLLRAAKKKTFAEAAQQYVDERRNYKTSSVRAYNSIFGAYLLPKFGKFALADIKESDLRKFLVDLTDKGLSRSRANTIMQLMRGVLAQALRDGEIDRDPSVAVKRLSTAKTKVDPFSEEELSVVLAHIDHHYRPFFTVQAFTGARPNELLALRFHDIDWVNQYISINKGRVRGHEGLPKTSSGERLVPMAAPVIDALESIRDASVRSLEDFVFTNTKGRPIDNHLGDVWQRAMKKSGLRYRPSYQLRHTFITQCILKGFPLPFVAKIVGHSTIDTLIRHYARWIESATHEQEQRLRASFALTVVRNSESGEQSGESSPTKSEKRCRTTVPKKNLEIRGFEPLASRVRSVRSTN